jgi:S-adenosylmethionine:tRNA ribosyltransferase-isomerase
VTAAGPSDPCALESYLYDIPEELIAQNPPINRDDARLMRVVRKSGYAGHGKFSDLPRLLRPGDLLVLNDTTVFRARLAGKKLPGGASVEIFFLSPLADAGDGAFHALVRPGRKLPPGSRVEANGGGILAIGGRDEYGGRVVRIESGPPASELFGNFGHIPLPPYIKRSEAPEDRYQTVYADPSKDRSAAAPTAGLHFTDGLLEELKRAGIEREFITLDVGLGTFRPVRTPDIRDHVMHGEMCEIGESAARRINAAKSAGRRIVAVGTTVVRTLESFADEDGSLRPGARSTDIFIRPGYRFRIIDAMITNFHLPGSTLLMLVSAFAGRELIMDSYRLAISSRYRFFSFGDAMLIE